MDYSYIWKEICQIPLIYILYLYSIILHWLSFPQFGLELSEEIVCTSRTIVARSPVPSPVVSPSKAENADQLTNEKTF